MTAYDDMIAVARGADYLGTFRGFVAKVRDDVADLVGTGLTNAVVYGARTLSAVDTVALVYSDAKVQNISISVTGKAVTMPAANANMVEGETWTIHNGGSNAYAVQDSTGADLIAALAADETALVKLIDDSTAAGLWIAVNLGGGSSVVDGIARWNILLNAFRIQVVGGLSVLDMIDGVADEFEDETGIDAPVSNRRSHTSASAYFRYSYSTYEALNAFDDNTGTYWFSNQTISTNSNGIDYLGVQLDAAYDIAKARIYNVDQAPATVKIQYSDDGSAWSDAVASWSLSGSIGAFVETTWASVGSHAYWRVLSSSATTADSLGNAGSGWKCAELEFYEIAGGASSNADYDATNDFYSPSTGTNMTLVSETTTAEAQPDEAHLVVWEEDVDSVTLNTDLLAYATRDGGTTWTQVTLVEEGSLSTGRILTGSADLSGNPAGTTMAWKLVSANSKELKIHAVGLEWR